MGRDDNGTAHARTAFVAFLADCCCGWRCGSGSLDRLNYFLNGGKAALTELTRPRRRPAASLAARLVLPNRESTFAHFIIASSFAASFYGVRTADDETSEDMARTEKVELYVMEKLCLMFRANTIGINGRHLENG